MKNSTTDIAAGVSPKTLKLLGETIRTHREKRNLTPAALAKIAGITPAQLNSVEKGASSVTLLIYLKISSALQLDFSKILGEASI